MKIIDAHSGKEVMLGWRTESGMWLESVEEHLLSAKAVFRAPNGGRRVVPLQVRYTHPDFFLQKVAFIPS